MKKLLLACLFVAGVSTLSYAQGGGGMGRTPEAQTAALKTSLSLTAEQEKKVMTIYTAQSKTMDSARTAMQGGGDMQSMMTKMQAMTSATNGKIKAILTP